MVVDDDHGDLMRWRLVVMMVMGLMSSGGMRGAGC